MKDKFKLNNIVYKISSDKNIRLLCMIYYTVINGIIAYFSIQKSWIECLLCTTAILLTMLFYVCLAINIHERDLKESENKAKEFIECKRN